MKPVRSLSRHAFGAATILALGAFTTVPATATQPTQVDADTRTAQEAPLTTASPGEVGLSGEVLARIGPAMQDFVDKGRTAGVMTMVARRGEIVHWDARGWRVQGEDPLEPNDIFRIYSMTKPVTSVAAMILVEDGLLSLDDEVGSLVPSFADVQVYQDMGPRNPDRPMLIRHLLTHTSGLSYGVFGTSRVDSMYNAMFEKKSGHPDPDLREWADSLASLPLVDDPGDRWNYSLSTDLLGRVVEVVSGRTLDRFFKERIFEPLGMHDTGFFVPEEKQDRFTTMYRPAGGGLKIGDSPTEGSYTQPVTWLSGGSGLVSTARDYLRFCSMLLGGGELDGVRLLESGTVSLMTRNHLEQDLVPIVNIPGMGFGLGFAVPAGVEDGTYWWAGVANTYFWVDPAAEIIAFAWTQLQPFGAAPVDRLLRPIVDEAILDGN